MKFYLLLFLSTLLPAILFAQIPRDWGAFEQRIDAKPYAGRNFRLQAAVRTDLIDSTAGAEIWVRVDRPDKKTGFFYNMMDKPIRTTEWKIFTITGRIDKDAEYLNYGGLYQRKGLFYFDDFRLYVEKEKGHFEEVAVAEGSFEGDSASVWNTWGYLQKRDGFKTSISNSDHYTGTQCFLVDGSSFKSKPTYGNNNSTGKYISVNGIRMYYEVYGKGEPLLLLHGNSEGIASFSKQIPELSKHYKVIALDSRGQGKSGEDGKTFTYELFAEDTKALLDALQLDSVNILGWSDGGNTGLIMAMRYPEKIKRLAVMGAVLYNDKTAVKPWVNKFLKKQEAELATDTTARAIFRKRMIYLLLHEPNIVAGELATISCPVLVMAGSDDAVKEQHTRLIAKSIENSQLVIFPKGNHYEPAERPQRFNKTVLDFLGQ